MHCAFSPLLMTALFAGFECWHCLVLQQDLPLRVTLLFL
jgi:hypothetical protein